MNWSDGEGRKIESELIERIRYERIRNRRAQENTNEDTMPYCQRHQRHCRRYIDGSLGCPECLADRALDLMATNSMREDF